MLKKLSVFKPKIEATDPRESYKSYEEKYLNEDFLKEE